MSRQRYLPASAPAHLDTALSYCVDDLPGANITGARLQGILDDLKNDRPVTRLALGFLQREGLEALYRLATEALTRERFRELALTEQAKRIEVTAAEERVRRTEERALEAALEVKTKQVREQAEAARLTLERDPKYIAKVQNRQLRHRYGIDSYVDEHCFIRLMGILRGVDANQRLNEKDFIWLNTAGKDYFSDTLRAAYHRLEANFFASEFGRTRDPWMAVNASGHFRKCGQAPDAESLLVSIDIDRQNSLKLKSALCTTRGGVMRDLMRWEKATHFGEQAHAFMPDDYRPCTLLGAIHMETGNYALGQQWYAKAVERGSTVEDVDRDLRKVFFRADKEKQAEMRAFLLREDQVRYAWVAQNNRRPGTTRPANNAQ